MAPRPLEKKAVITIGFLLVPEVLPLQGLHGLAAIFHSRHRCCFCDPPLPGGWGMSEIDKSGHLPLRHPAQGAGGGVTHLAKMKVVALETRAAARCTAESVNFYCVEDRWSGRLSVCPYISVP